MFVLSLLEPPKKKSPVKKPPTKKIPASKRKKDDSDSEFSDVEITSKRKPTAKVSVQIIIVAFWLDGCY